MKIKDILGISNARLIVGDPNALLANFSKDTRTIQAGDTYIAFTGENFDGNDYYEEAFLKGAQTCILSKLEDPQKACIKYALKNILLVDDPTFFITQLATIKRASLNIPVIAVTGSVGKTSTKNLIADVLAEKYHVLKTPGNLNTNIGLSLTILNYQNEDCLVLEMGMNQFGEIAVLTNIAKPTIAVITNIGTSHIGNLGSRENILKAKLEILEGLNGPIIVNNDNDLLHKWASLNNTKDIITFGIAKPSLYQARNLQYSKDGCSFSLLDHTYRIPVFGKAFVYNSLVAIIVGKLLHVEDAKLDEALANIKTEEHRMQIMNQKKFTIIDDTYNASYDSVVLALDVLKEFLGRKIAVLGDILELGEFGEEIHRKIGKVVANIGIDLLITVGPLAHFINEEALNYGFDAQFSYHFENNDDAISFLKANLQQDDVVLVKASHGMNFLKIVQEIADGN